MKPKVIPIREAYLPIQVIFLDILKDRPEAKNTIQFSQNKGNLSISFFDPQNNNKSFWVTIGKKKSKLEWKFSYYLTIDSLMGLRDTVTPDKTGRVSEPFLLPEELYHFSNLILTIYDYRELESSGQLFDCCHRYIECSDAKDCTHPDLEFRNRCTYRGKLKRGIIFFGENRNID